MIYGHTATLPVNLELAPYPIESSEEEEQEVLKRAFDLLELLPEKLAEASLNIEENQNKVKKWYDSKISKPRTYQKDDLVWLFDAQRFASHSRKLDPKWQGPYAIHETLSYGAYRLKESNTERVLSATYHGSQLKPLRVYPLLEPVIILPSPLL